jgi:hypothetical protein
LRFSGNSQFSYFHVDAPIVPAGAAGRHGTAALSIPDDIGTVGLWDGTRLSPQKITLRSRDEVASVVAGLEVVLPGLVPACDWRPAPDDPSFDEVIPLYGVVARKP